MSHWELLIKIAGLMINIRLFSKWEPCSTVCNSEHKLIGGTQRLVTGSVSRLWNPCKYGSTFCLWIFSLQSCLVQLSYLCSSIVQIALFTNPRQSTAGPGLAEAWRMRAWFTSTQRDASLLCVVVDRRRLFWKYRHCSGVWFCLALYSADRFSACSPSACISAEHK